MIHLLHLHAMVYVTLLAHLALASDMKFFGLPKEMAHVTAAARKFQAVCLHGMDFKFFAGQAMPLQLLDIALTIS